MVMGNISFGVACRTSTMFREKFFIVYVLVEDNFIVYKSSS